MNPIPLPYRLLAIGLLILAALAAGIMAWNAYTTKLDKLGYDRGVNETTVAYQTRDNAQLKKVVAELEAANSWAAKAEDEVRKSQEHAANQYRKGVSDGKAKTAVLVAAARADALRLYDPGKATGISPADCGSPATTAPSGSTGGGDGKAGTKLSVASAEFLLSLSGEADDIVRQLAAAQQVIVSDRVLCKGESK